MGQTQTTSAPSTAREAAAGGCPVMSKNASPQAPPVGSCPVKQKPEQAPVGCPVKYKNPKQFNVYSQEINPDNMMPANPNQLPGPEQTKPIDTTRVKSNIPKGGTQSDTWTYPSPQMFYNALKRKGKGDDVTEDDVDAIVAVHNNMNERTWKKVLEWEAMHCDECESSTLLRFIGRPDELSPKARVKHWLGGPAPFDRHDWTVDRCGKEVRYVIDYYYDDEKGNLDQMPALNDEKSVRPALDSVEACVDRIKMGTSQLFSDSMPAAGTTATKKTLLSEAKGPDPADRKLFEERMLNIRVNCEKCLEAANNCEGVDQCAQATMALNFCMGKIVCETEAQQFSKALGAGSDAESDKAFNDMSDCLQSFGQSSKQYTN